MKGYNFKEREQTKMGELAEEMILNEFVQSKNSYPFRPAIDGTHPIDSVNISQENKMWAMDMKCKPRRKYYADTGIDLRFYNSYGEIDKTTPVYLLFVDTYTGTIYGNWMRFLTPKFEGNMVYFNLDQMVHYRYLDQEEILLLQKHNKSNYYNFNQNGRRA